MKTSLRTLAMLIVAGSGPLAATAQSLQGDMNGDGLLTVHDLTLLATAILEFQAPDVSGDYVDLGLPSHTLWATCNVGASTPEGYGDYFAWGETAPKSSYLRSNYAKPTDSVLQLSLQYDAARVRWGQQWCMPTAAQQHELRTECSWTWTTQQDIKGYVIQGPNGKTMFLPSAGYRMGPSTYDAGQTAHYWSSTPYIGNGDYAYSLSSKSEVEDNSDDCHKGFTIRAVRAQ